MAKRIELPKEIDKKIDKAIDKILDACAEKMSEDIKEKYRSVITDFYHDYPKPRSYNRSLESRMAYNMRDGDYKKITTKINDFTVRINFKIDSKYIEGNPYRARNKEWVFNRTLEGIHGWTPEEVNDYTGGANYANYSTDGTYHINPMLYWYNVPKPMSPSPREIMKSWEKEYKNPVNLRRVLQPIAKKILNESI